MGKIEDNLDLILQRFLIDLYSANMIAEELEVSRQGIIVILRAHGIDTSKAVAGWVQVECSLCKRPYKIPRSVVRRKKEKKEPNFCGADCFVRWKKNRVKERE